jgi:hypothetical protein
MQNDPYRQEPFAEKEWQARYHRMMIVNATGKVYLDDIGTKAARDPSQP